MISTNIMCARPYVPLKGVFSYSEQTLRDNKNYKFVGYIRSALDCLKRKKSIQ